MKASQLRVLLQYAFKNNFPVLIKGQPGVGKSDVVEQATNACIHSDGLPYDLLITHPVVQDPTEGSGIPWVVDGVVKKLPLANLRRMIEADRPLVVFLDDLGQASPAVQAAYMQLLLARQIDGVAISRYVRFVAATNRREDRASVSGILEPVKSRFNTIVQLDVDANDWLTWARGKGMPKELIFFIDWDKSKLNEFKPTKDIENSPCPRTVAKLGDMINAGIPDEIWFETVAGAVGQSFASGFKFFMDCYLSLPTIGQIVSDPHGTPVPREIQGRFAIASLIMERMDTTNITPLIAYCERLEKELRIAVIKTATTHNPAIMMTRDFTTWITRYQQDLM